MNSHEWGIDLEDRIMWYIPWTIDSDGKYREPTIREREEIYGISGEAVRETLLYFEECGGNTHILIDMLNRHVLEKKYKITREELLDNSRWYNNEYYFYFIMFTKKVIGRYNFHYGENRNEQLSVFHKIYEKGFLTFIPWGYGIDANLIHDQTLGNISGPLLFFEEKEKNGINDFLFFLNSVLPDLYSVERDFFNNQLIWVNSEFSDFCYEFLKILSDKEMFFREAAFNSGMSKLRLVKIIANVPTQSIMSVFVNGTKKSNEIFDYSFNSVKNGELAITAEIRDSFDLKKFSIYRKSILLNRGIINKYGFIAIITKLYQLQEKIYSNIIYKDTGFEIIFNWKTKGSKIIRFYSYSIIVSVLYGLLAFYFFKISKEFIVINSFILFIILSIFLKFKFLMKLSENKLNEINKSSMEQMESLEKTSASLLEERNLLEQKVSERTAELAEANEKLRDLDRVKTDFFANISHELRTPLTLILSPVERALAGTHLETETLEMMRRNGENLLSLINDLLEVSRITAGRMTLKVTETDICEFVKQCCGEMESAAKIKGIELECSTCGSHINAFYDMEAFSHVLSNLFSNSFKFTENGGRIGVSVFKTDDSALISFSDTGCGIPEDKLQTIFNRFTQADTGTARRYEGTGIGLSIIKDLVELHGGTVSVQSRFIDEYPEDHGTVFTVKIPSGKSHLEGRTDIIFSEKPLHHVILPHVRGIDAAYGVSSTAGGSINTSSESDLPVILVVEDNSDLRMMLENMLSGRFTVYTAGNGLEAINILEKVDEIDLVLSDIMMPGMDGHELLRWIRADEKFEGLPVVFLTARADHFMKIEGLDLGAIDYVTKPFNSDELLLRIRNQMEQRRLRNSLIRNYNNLTAKLKAVNVRNVTGENITKIENICGFIREHFMDDLTREQLASAAGLNPDTFSRMFNQHTGKTLSDYINELRVEEAKRRLFEPENTVTRICIDTGCH